MTLFSVQSALICDFATQDAGGKPILVGIRYGDIRFDETPRYFPACFVNVVVTANASKFEFSIKFLDPSDDDLYTIKSIFDADDQIVRGEVLIINVQIPPLRFTSEGTHNLVVYDRDETEIFRQPYEVFCRPKVKFSAQLSGSVVFNPKFRKSTK